LKGLVFYLLGMPRLERDSRPVEVDTRKAIALLAYLALTGKQQSRDTLAAFLWPDYSQTNARAALRRTLSALHRGLGAALLETGREVLNLPSGSGLWVDVSELQRCLAQCAQHGHPANQVCPQCLPWLNEAARLYQGHFMAGFTLRDSVEFDDWQFQQSETLRRELAGALERLVQGHAAQGEYEAALGHAQRWLSLDHLHEPAHRQLMQLYTLAGQHSAALRQYQVCVHILEKELGVSPLQETTQLYLDIKEQRGIWSPQAARQREETDPQPGISSLLAAEQRESWSLPPSEQEPAHGQVRIPFVGREFESGALLRAHTAIQRDGCFVVLEGEAGIGKTRLAEEFLADARTRGARVISARCYSGETQLAYAPIVEGISNALGQTGGRDADNAPAWHQDLPAHWLAEAARLLPELSRLRADIPSASSAESPGAQARFFEGLCQVILALCGAQPPGVLFIDDLHWADEASLNLLTYLVRRLHDRPLLILATWRGEDLVPGHRLRSLLAESQRQGSSALLALPRLTIEAVSKMVQAYAPASGVPAPDFNQRLYQETEGLPFFVVEYLAALPEGAAITSPENWPIPHGVRDLLHTRLSSSGETGWQLLQAAAVLGRSFDFDTLHEASGRSEEETISALEQLITRGLIREAQPVNADNDLQTLRLLDYDFNHEKLRSLVYSETSLARRRLLHQRAADALVTHGRGRHDLPALSGQIAYHYKQGGRARESAEYFRMAGEHARSLYANAEALAHFQSALSLGHPDTAGVNEAIGDMYTLLGSYTAAIHSYETAMAQVVSQPQATGRLAHKLGEIYHRLGEWEQAESYFQAGMAALQASAETAAQAHLYAAWSRTVHQRGQSQRASELATQALELARTAADQPGLAQAHNILGILARSRGDLPEATRHLEHSLALAEEMGQPTARVAALNNLSLAYADRGDLEQAIGYASRALDLCIQLGDRHRAAALHNNLADLYHVAGREAEAMAHLKQAVVIFAEVGGDIAYQDTERANPEIWKLTEW